MQSFGRAKTGRGRNLLNASTPDIGRDRLIFGIHAVLAALRNNPSELYEVWVHRGRQDARLNDLRALAAARNVRLREVKGRALDQQAQGNRHQGAIAWRHPSRAAKGSRLSTLLDKRAYPLILVLDGVTDPHNLGAILRTAEAAGVDAVLIPKDHAVGMNATVRKVACGAAERVPLLQVTNLARELRELKDAGLWLIGTDHAAPRSFYDLDLQRPLALLMGSEDKGLRRLTRESCDFVARVPLAGETESLNVSVAAGVCLFEIQRQRRVHYSAQ